METVKKSLYTALLVEGSLLVFFGRVVYSDLPPENRSGVLWTFIVGTAMILAGMVMLKNNHVYDRIDHWLQHIGTWFSVSPLQAFFLITSPVFTILAIHAAGLWIRMRSPAITLIAWSIGIGLAFLGLWNWAEDRPRISYRTVLWLAGLTLLAFLLRGISTDRIPILLTGDEASAGLTAVRFANGEMNNPFITAWFSFPTLFSFLQSLSINTFENSVVALRIPSAVAGALTVGAVYLCGKMMFGHRAGLFASLILASSHFHIHFSRLGLNNIWDGLWFTLTISMLWYGWKYHTRWAYLLAGLSFGFSQYFYASSKALIIVLLISATIAFFSRRAQFRSETPNFVAAFTVALAIFMPLAWYYIQEPNAFLAPFARVSIVKETLSSSSSVWSLLFQRIPTSWGAYTHTQLADWYHPGSPILRPISATFFYIGMIFLLFDNRDSRSMFLITWLVTFAFINALSSFTTPAAQRYVASAPACALIASYGLDQLAKNLENLWLKVRILVQGAAYLILVIIVASDLLFYFVNYTSSSYQDELKSNGMVAYQVGSYLQGQPSDTQAIFFGFPRMGYDSPAILYLAPQIHGMNAPENEAALDTTLVSMKNILFIFLPEYQDEIDKIEKKYPNGILTTHKTWNGETLFWVYQPATP